MREFLHSPLFRCLTCIILICCILLNTSPIRSEASAIVVGATVSAAGVFATLFAMAMGVVFVDLTADLINGLGVSFVDHITKSSSTDNEQEILSAWIQPIQVDLDSGGISQLPPDGDDNGNSWSALAGLFTIPEELKDNFLSWAKDLINDICSVDVDNPDYLATSTSYLEYEFGDNGFTQMFRSDEPFGYAFFNFPDEEYLSIALYNSTGGVIETKLSTWDTWSGCSFKGSRDGVYIYYTGFAKCETEEYVPYIGTISADKTSAVFDAVVSFLNIPEKITVEPAIYVGDIPQKVQNGDFDDDDFALPYINPTKIWENQTDAIEALNNTATQLQNQTMTYDQYMEQIQTPTGGNTGTGSNPGNTTDPDVSDELSDYTFDLRDIFPFCIPFDLYDFFACLDAPPEAPVINWEIYLPGGGVCPITLDLSCFDEVAQLLRRLELLLFCIGLAFKTRDLIKG